MKSKRSFVELVASADLFDSAQVVEDSESSKAIDRNVATKRYANSYHRHRTCCTVDCDGLMRPAHHASYSSFVVGHEEVANGQNIGGPAHILASAQFLPARRRVVIFAPRVQVSKSRHLLSPFLLVEDEVGGAETRQCVWRDVPSTVHWKRWNWVHPLVSGRHSRSICTCSGLPCSTSATRSLSCRR